MSDLESGIKDVISKKLEDGTVEKLIAEQLEKGINHALENLLRSYGDVTKIIEEKIKSVMVPYLENYDYSKYIIKLDAVLVEVLKSSASENKKLLENFQELIIPVPEKEIKLTDLFNRWMDYVANNVETNGLDICYDDEPTYQNVDVRFWVEFLESRPWSNYECAHVFFECDHDEKMNFELKIHRWPKYDKEKWTIDFDVTHNLNSLRHLSNFEVFLMKLKQNRTQLIIDCQEYEDEVEVEARPEATFE